MTGNTKENSKSFVKNAEDLRVFQLAFEISLQVHKATLDFPKTEQYALADQMRRASKSICANIAEGFARQQKSTLEFQRFILIAIGSAAEMRVWLKYALALGYIEQKWFDSWISSYISIERMLQKLKG